MNHYTAIINHLYIFGTTFVRLILLSLF